MITSLHLMRWPIPLRSVSGFNLNIRAAYMVAGMTGSGKTAWVQSLLTQAYRMINLPPERIVRCYSQWQSAYMDLLVTVPNIEFVKGIPTALEQDSYFNVNKRNLIVLDDQMIDAGKDQRIVNLFTRGSHHRNLSAYTSYRTYSIREKAVAALV